MGMKPGQKLYKTNTSGKIYRYRPERAVPENAYRDVLFFSGKDVDPETGYLREALENTAANIEPFRVGAESILRWKSGAFTYRIFFYGSETDERWMSTFSYEPESNWTCYDRSRSHLQAENTETAFPEEGFVRLVIQSSKGGELPEDLQELFEIEDSGNTFRENDEIRPCFEKEIGRIRKKLEGVQGPDDAVLFLLADTHYAVNGGWEETEKNLKAAAAVFHPDAAVHLGDLTDGLLPGAQTMQYAGRVLQGMRVSVDKVYGCLGNHDSNYFRNNPEAFKKAEAARWYFGHPKEYYYADLPEKRLRLIFLSSFDREKKKTEEKYGFSLKERLWLKKTLRRTPDGFRILLFSHVPLLPEMHVWSEGIRGSGELLRMLEEFQKDRHMILAFLHGHNHADQVEKNHAFPIVAVGCGKLESFPEMKPAGAVCYERKKGTVTQELWDVIRISGEDDAVDLFRFGAGRDRHLEPDQPADGTAGTGRIR